MADQSGNRESGTVDMPAKSSSGRILKILFFVFLLCAGYMALLFLSSILEREIGRMALCKNNMKELGLALLVFHDVNKHFPGYDDPDNPEYSPCSWRVHLLPQLQRKDLHERYDRTQPWDSNANVALQEISIDLLHCPTDPNTRNDGHTDTDYVSIVGPNCVFCDKGSITIDDISDGASNTIMLVESADTGIHWMEPRDLKFEDARIVEDDSTGSGIRSYHAGVVMTTFCDGSAKGVSKDIDPKLLKALMTVNGGESIESFHEQY